MTAGCSPLTCVVLCCYSWQRGISFQDPSNLYCARYSLGATRSTNTSGATSRRAGTLLADRIWHGRKVRSPMAIYRSTWFRLQRLAQGFDENTAVGDGVRGGSAPIEGEGTASSTTGDAVAMLRLDRRMETVHLPAGRGVRVHCLSDIHADFSSNREWLKTWSSWKGNGDHGQGMGHEDILLIPGDVSSSMERLEETLSDLTDRYDQVFFVVGNHDLWTGPPRRATRSLKIDEQQKDKEEDREMTATERTEDVNEKQHKEATDIDSVDKLIKVHRLCEQLRVRTSPATFVFGGNSEAYDAKTEEALVLFPLLSWYHASWDSEPDLPPEDQHRNGKFLNRWQDYRRCRWPVELCKQEDFVTVARDAPKHVADFFARQNDACIEEFLAGEHKDEDFANEGASHNGDKQAQHLWKRNATVITFSHFVPRQELCPEKRFLLEPMLPKAIGSAPLEAQIRQLRSDVHVYGHTHIPFDIAVDGVRYVQWPLGSSLEQTMQCKRMRQEGPLLVYEHDGRTGGLTPEQSTYWGNYYRETPRDLQSVEVPEWISLRLRAKRKRQAPPGMDLPWRSN